MKTNIVAVAAVLAGMACQVDEGEDAGFRIAPVCVEGEGVPEDAWACSEPLVIDCNEASVPDEIHVVVGDGECASLDLQEVPGPFPPGSHDIVVVDGDTGTAVCTTELVVTDALPPDVSTLELSLWPPNHKFHDITLADCIDVVDDCDPEWTAAIDFVSSDEPVNDKGDGNTEPDIEIVASDAVHLRSERQGGSNGRVYTIGFTVVDGSGNASEGECRVVVDHDQGNGQAIDDGESYRVEP